MIKVTIEILPFGNEKNRTKIGELNIYNTGVKKEDRNKEYILSQYNVDANINGQTINRDVFHNRNNNIVFLLERVFSNICNSKMWNDFDC